jgi:hypothetical protein
LLQGCRDDALAEFDVGGGSDRGDGTFWKRPAVHAAFGQIVGVALLSIPAAAGGPLNWTSDEQRFWPLACEESWRARLAFMQVLDVACIGNFMADSMEPQSDDVELAPISAEPSRMPLFQISGGSTERSVRRLYDAFTTPLRLPPQGESRTTPLRCLYVTTKGSRATYGRLTTGR